MGIEANEMENGGPTLSLALGEDVGYGGFMPPDGEVEIVGLGEGAGIHLFHFARARLDDLRHWDGQLRAVDAGWAGAMI